MSALAFIPIFETKSNRVKGVAFHPSRPWVLASLHNGVIQLWDYRIRTMVDRFGEHDGPVRAVDFHRTQPLFVSGGDDYKIKVWNYKERRCLFTLTGHLDYIRTVQFHHEYPWILSSSDDQTIRIWNWQSRQCQAVLTGHSHYVMCAQFHPTEDLVVSASLDQTVRVWDISALRKQNIAPMANREDSATKLQNNLFGSTDASVKFVLEGHDRGVNWATFHPSTPFIVSGADDRQIKLWRMSETKAWEVDTMRGHYNNVCATVFHATEDLMLSLSEDKTVRVWDMSKRQTIFTYRRDHDRFWVIAAHPKLNLFVAGHDSGLVVFKLAHERPPYCAYNNEVLFYIKDRYLKSFHFESGRDTPIASLRKATGGGLRPRGVHFNPRENAVIVTYTGDGERYEVFTLPKEGQSGDNINPKGSLGRSAVWINRNRFAVLDKSNIIYFKDINNESKKKITPPHAVDNIFSAAVDTLLLRSDDRITLYDTVQERSTGQEAKIFGVKQAIWSHSKGGDKGLVAFINSTGVVIANHKLEILFSLLENMRVKSGVWDDTGAFIYSTLSHIKYALPNGDHGIVRTLDRPIYITAVKGNKVYCIDRQGKNRAVTIDTTEYTFKQALTNKRFDEVLRMVKNSNLIGQAIIGYLQRQGYPEVALHFVKDEKTRFNLALECSNYMKNIEIALKCAQTMDDKESWTKLGQAALRQGNNGIVEDAYKQTLDFEKLSFFYVVTGYKKNLTRMLDIAINKRKDVNARYYNSLLLGNIEERVQVLLEQGQYQLAYMTAITHGLSEQANAIKERLQREHEKEHAGKEEIPPLVLPEPIPDAKLFVPPVALTQDKSNWPLTRVPRGPFDMAISDTPGIAPPVSRLDSVQDDTEAPPEKWGEELAVDNSDGETGFKTPEQGSETEINESEGWPVDDDIPDLNQIDAPQPRRGGGVIVTLPPSGQSRMDQATRTSSLAADSVAAGRFEDAMRLLNQQIGIVNFQPLKPHFLRIYQASTASIIGIGGLPPLKVYLEREPSEGQAKTGPCGPFIALSLQSAINDLSEAYKAVTNGKFTEAKTYFENILQALPLVVARTRSEASEIVGLIDICREYLLGIATEIERKDVVTAKGPESRVLELSAYFTLCALQTKHTHLTLKSAMNAHAKSNNFGLAADFGRRLLDSSPTPAIVDHVQKVLALCEKKGYSNAININYDPRNPCVLCGKSLSPIYQGSPNVKCLYCGTAYKEEFAGKLCNICGIAEIGKQGAGLMVMESAKKKKF